jgi:GTP pyrophosphokinase
MEVAPSPAEHRTLHEESGLILKSKEKGLPLSDKELKTLRDRLETLLKKLPPEPEPELESLPRRAFEFAVEHHSGQKRVSGEPYVTHPLIVAELVAALVPDRPTLAACLLHDVLEDTDATPEQIKKEFGEEVAFLVEGVTNVSRIRFGLSLEKQIENLRRLLVHTAKDLRVIIIKLCDRLHNMRTLGALPSIKRRRICQSTLDVFAPLAHRLGLERIKNELEDLCLMYMHPQTYKEIKSKVDERLASRQEYARKVQNIVADVLATNGIDASVEWRVKHFWSIFQKMGRDNKDFSEVYDLTGIRILVNALDQCYASLGIIHGVWPPVEGRFKDYISRPKANDYRSLHTTVLGPEGRLLEIQIRTIQMHRVNEEGVAAHWRYKERGRSSKRLGDDAAWISQMSGILQDTDQEEWTSSLKTDLFSDEAYCYTPKGDIVRLPAGSCPIDFAYHVHTQLGDHCHGARVNGRFVPLSYQLKTGDVVEIETSKGAHPSPDWLTLVKSSRARTKIRSSLLQANRETLIEQGRVMLSRELHRLGQNPPIFFGSDLCREIMDSLETKTLDDLFALIGFGRIATKQVVARVMKSKAKEKKGEPVKAAVGETIRLSDIDDLLYRLARCCHPVPGENIIGLVTRGRGISIHREDCINIRKFGGDKARLIPIHWEENGLAGSATEITLEANDRHQLLADITNVISSSGIDIRGCNTVSDDHSNKAHLSFQIMIRNIDQLRRLASHLIEIPGIIKVSQKRGSRTVPLA